MGKRHQIRFGEPRGIGRILYEHPGRVARIERSEIFPIKDIGRRPPGKQVPNLQKCFKI